MKLRYFELLSPDPVRVQTVGGIISPKLKSISSIGINTYQYYLSILLLDSSSYFSMIGRKEQYEALSDAEKRQFNVYDLLTMHKQTAVLLQDVLNFFIEENIIYSPESNSFLVQNGEKPVGTITKGNYSQICDLICQRNYIRSKSETDLSTVKSKKALEIMKKLKKGRAEKIKQTKDNSNMELGNIISAVANKSTALNILNIWDLTVFQLWDCFYRISNNHIYDIQSMSVAAWGDKDKHFDATLWFKKMEIDN